MKSWKDWKEADAFARDYSARVEDLTPEPLFESFHMPSPKICLRCGREWASSALYSPFTMESILPLCVNCAADWNFAGYAILRGLKPTTLLMRLAKFKLRHPLSRPSVVEIGTDMQKLRRWGAKMARVMKTSAPV